MFKPDTDGGEFLEDKRLVVTDAQAFIRASQAYICASKMRLSADALSSVCAAQYMYHELNLVSTHLGVLRGCCSPRHLALLFCLPSLDYNKLQIRIQVVRDPEKRSADRSIDRVVREMNAFFARRPQLD